MEKLDLSKVKKYKKRIFVPEKADLQDRNTVEGLYAKIVEREINSSEEFRKWMIDYSELEIAMDQHGAILYINMTLQTDDQCASAQYSHFIKEIIPVIRPLEHKVNLKFLDTFKKFPIDEDFYAIYLQCVQSDINLFIEENIDLKTKVSLLSQKYQEVSGAMTIVFQGKEMTLMEAGKRLLSVDRDLRQCIWEVIANRRLKEKEIFDSIFDEMVSLRDKISKNANCKNYCEYKFIELHRFDYTLEDCTAYHDAIEEFVVPLWKKILERRKKQMNVSVLRPWDLSADPQGREELKPFDKSEDLIAGCAKILLKIDQEIGFEFNSMVEGNFLDVENRKGKAPGGYQSTLTEVRKPYIFMNAVGTENDVRTLLHESGHAFHSIACSNFSLLHYLHAPMEFSEVASMSMELLSLDYLSVFYENLEDQKRAIASRLEDVIFVLIWVATIDAFQQWIYENPKHTATERSEAWLEIRKRFDGGIVDWDGYEEVHRCLWHKQLHIFEVPFYYIEYGIAQLGALQIWLNSRRNFSETIEKYKRALSFGGSKPLCELFKIAGIDFNFSKEIIIPLINEVQKELDV